MHKSKKKHHRKSNHEKHTSSDPDRCAEHIGNLNITEHHGHKTGPRNQIYEVCSSDKIGRYIVATKELRPGDVVLSELPIVVGPLSGNYGVVCIGCYVCISREQLANCFKCKSCNWPLCNAKCSGLYKDNGHTKLECNVLSKAKLKLDYNNYAAIEADFSALVPFRCLILKDSPIWPQILKMEAHDEIRRNVPELWNTNQLHIVDRLRQKWGLPYTEGEIHTVCGYLEVNAFEIGHNGVSLRALYPSAFLLAHDCVPNTTHIDEERSYKLTIRASVRIGIGETISLSYAHTLQSTLKRRESLLENKFFLCECKRCTDPTELGTYLSALKCPKCLNGNVLSRNPLDANAEWICVGVEETISDNRHSRKSCDNKCVGYTVSSESMKNVMKRIGAEIDDIYCNDIASYEAFLKRYCNVLHPNHYHCINVKHALSQLYGKIGDYMIHELSDELLQRKISLCRELLEIFNILEPGLSRLRGITLYELHAPLMILVARDFDTKLISKSVLKLRLKEIISCLDESYTILSFEPRASSEGMMAEAAKEALLKIKNWQKIIGKI